MYVCKYFVKYIRIKVKKHHNVNLKVGIIVEELGGAAQEVLAQ